jgi:sugar phosphate isomerase/epimerase
MAISRREFLKTASAVGAAGLLTVDLQANPLGMPIGCQTWPVREMIGKDFPGTVKKLAAAGFQTIELCSPVGYSDSGFEGLAKYKPDAIRKVMADAGMGCVSSHFTIDELRHNQDDRIAWAKELGLTQMLVPTLEGPKNPTMDDVKRAADEYNKIGERAAKAGIQQGLHTEDFELSMVEGKRTYDVLLELLDPQLVKFQFQAMNVNRGYDPVAYFAKYPGRYISLHVQGWSFQTKKMAVVGQDSLDWKNIFTAAKQCGVKNYFLEMGLPLMEASVPYLRNLQV